VCVCVSVKGIRYGSRVFSFGMWMSSCSHTIC
jgi:hypothetical protein